MRGVLTRRTRREQKLEQLTHVKAQRFTLVGQPEQYRQVALRLDEYARRLAGSLQKYNLKLLDPDDDLHQAIAQVCEYSFLVFGC